MSRWSTPMSPQYEAVVRLVHGMGRASVAEVLSAYRARPLSARALAKALDVLTCRGWLDKRADARRRSPRAVAYQLSEIGTPHLLTADRLPLHPLPLAPRRPHHLRGATPMAAPLLAPCRTHLYQPYVPPPAPPMRAGALDFLQYPSHGACR